MYDVSSVRSPGPRVTGVYPDPKTGHIPGPLSPISGNPTFVSKRDGEMTTSLRPGPTKGEPLYYLYWTTTPGPNLLPTPLSSKGGRPSVRERVSQAWTKGRVSCPT